MDKVRTVLDHFLAKFPLCYGYWQKYANAESSLGDTASTEAVLERAVAATPYSIEIWLHYIAWKRKQPDCSDESVRRCASCCFTLPLRARCQLPCQSMPEQACTQLVFRPWYSVAHHMNTCKTQAL